MKMIKGCWMMAAFSATVTSVMAAAPITRSLLVHPDEFTDKWIDRASAIGLDVLAMHPVGGSNADQSLTNLLDLCRQPGFRARVDRAIAKGITVEYEFHAGTWLLPRDLFKTHPEYFRMDESGRRVQRFNFCPSSLDALEIVAKRARELARGLYRSSNRYYFWLDDVEQQICQCPKCRGYSASDLQLIVFNRIVAELRKDDPSAKLAFLAYAATIRPPTKVKPAEGIFLEYAPIHRTWDRPAREQPVVNVSDIRALLDCFGRKDARVLEYWYDNSLFSRWTKPPKKFAVNADVLRTDVAWYRELGFETIASFACYLGDDYEKLWGVPDVSAFALNSLVPTLAAPQAGVPNGCNPAVMSEKYWQFWNAEEQAKIDADIEANRKANGEFSVPVPAGTKVKVEQLAHDFRFGAHIFNFNQLGKTEYNDAYKASYGAGGIFNQATVAFYWANYEPVPGKLRAVGGYEDTEAYWNALSQEAAMLDVYWRRPAAGPVIDFLKSKDVAIHGHILIWGLAKPYWIYDWYCPENEKRAFDALGIPRHSTFLKRARAGSEHSFGFAKAWMKAWERVFKQKTEAEIAALAPTFTKNMRRIFKKRVFDVAGAFGDVVDSWDVVNESAFDWMRYRQSRTGLPVWSSQYGLMPGDYPLWALLDAKEAMAPSAKLAINDYRVGEDFRTQVKQLEGEGARIDIVGCQMHIFNTNDCMRLAKGDTDIMWVGTPSIIQGHLDTMAKTGKPLHVSEITITSPGADDASRQIQAILTRNIYRKWFSHKALMGITWWNTVDGGGVYGEPLVSGLFTRDMKKKPAYLALDELINHEWRTCCEVKVEGQGQQRCGNISFRGFRGRYRLSWKCPDCGHEHSREVYLTGDGVKETSPAACPPDCFLALRKYVVDGKPVTLANGETKLDLGKLYSGSVKKGVEGEKWAEVAFTLTAPKDGEYTIFRHNDWFGELSVNGAASIKVDGPWDDPVPQVLKLKAGANEIRYRTRAGTSGLWTLSIQVPGDSPLTLN